VLWLKALLSARGFKQTESIYLDWAALSGVRGFAKTLGVRDAHLLQAFDPAWLVYLPRESMTIAQVAITMAAPAPSTGTVVAESTEVLDGAALLEAGTATDSQMDLEHIPTSSDLDRLIGTSGVIADVTEEMRYAGDMFALDDSRQRLDGAGLALLSERIPAGTQGLIVQLGQQPRESWWVVPPAALSMSDGTSVCVGRAGDRRPIAVSVVDAGGAGTIVEGQLRNDDVVRIPAESASTPCQ